MKIKDVIKNNLLFIVIANAILKNFLPHNIKIKRATNKVKKIDSIQNFNEFRKCIQHMTRKSSFQ